MREFRLFVAAAFAAAVGWAEEPTYDLTSLLPLDVYDTATPSAWSQANADGLYLANGGFVEPEVSKRPVAGNNNGATYRLAHASYGMLVSEQKADFSLGDWCTYLPVEDASSIDWAKTGEAIRASDAYLKEGRLYYNDSATTDVQRVLFTRGGTVSIDWHLKDATVLTRTYQVASTARTRPYRLFWTEQPFSAPKVSVSGKHVRLFGDPGLISPTYEVTVMNKDPYVASSNVVRGVVHDATTDTLRAYAKTVNVDTATFDGPEGQFVLAYYDTGSKDTLIYTVVVEVARPDLNVVNVHVGDRLMPLGVGYDTTNMVAKVISGLTAANDNDPNMPYVYQHQSASGHGPNEDAVFSIAPTDASSSKLDLDSPWKVDIWWQTLDPAGTLWPFENDQYLSSWGGDLPVVVTDGTAGTGGVLVPKEYNASVCGYSDPMGIATIVSNRVQVSAPGFFTIKLTANENVWFVPCRAERHDNPDVFDLTAVDWHVGSEIRPRNVASHARAQALLSQVDGSLPGFIHVAGSTAKNWNPRLYHEPSAKTQAQEVTDPNNTDAYDALASAIYAVNASENPIEVWWYRRLATDPSLPDLSIPTVVQRYRAVWPSARETHEIVLASEKGSGAAAVSCEGRALYLAEADARAEVTDLDVADADGAFTFGAAVNPSPRSAGFPAVGEGRLVTIAAGTETVSLDCGHGADGAYKVDVRINGVIGRSVAVPTNRWTYIACTVDADGAVMVSSDGSVVGEAGRLSSSVWATETCTLRMGAGPASVRAATGVALDNLCIWSDSVSPTNFSGFAAGGELAARTRYAWPFDGAVDLEPLLAMADRVAIDAASGRTLKTSGCLAMEPGGPVLTRGVFAPEGEAVPRVYYNNDRQRIGYNPNEEHAFMRKEEAGYVVYALRCDLNTADSSEPFVLVEYAHDGKGAMRAFAVSLTNELHRTLSSDVTVGGLMVGPHPLDYLDGYYNTKNYCAEISTNDDSAVVYADRCNRMWARRDGTTYQFNYYPVQEGFAFPSLDADRQLAPGTLVGWMNCRGVDKPTAGQLTTLPSCPWEWTARWPADDQIPTMRVAQTLTTATAGLPEVWNAASMAVVYPAPVGCNVKSDDTVVTLIDPTVARTAPLPFTKDFPQMYGFTVGNAGTAQLRNGRYYFTGLPPNISDRFYIDTSAGEDERMVLVGKMVEKKAGTGYLQINQLTDDERRALRDLCPLATNTVAHKYWTDAVDCLAIGEVQPSPRNVSTASLAVSHQHGTIRYSESPRVKVSYKAADHYALVANGCGTNYVTLIENDNPDTQVVPEGSAISMHVLKVVPELNAGPLVVLQDPNNKLSEQLNILYAEPFGAASTNFVFEWRKTAPPSDGAVPTDYGDWATGLAGEGLTRILLGGHGTSLEELVNTYYVMRYRAKEGSQPYQVTGDRWSDWCGPTLAEGWVQRVLNNVTPFAQRIADFHSTESELLYTMPEQIGRPYVGDVALNDANLEDVGLLELYQTVLNKAESISLSLGTSSPAANSQLMEAVSRLAELYTLLGDEAYSDAKNPTIAVSSTDGLLSFDKGLAGSTFCFANQVPSLLDEELALLRGRSDAVAPNMTTYPYYNRLMWNFTKGITQGEVAYVMNYGIGGEQGEITVEQAASLYPQGHGDAYGHYLSAIWGYYRLLRNPNFTWGEPAMLEMLVADAIVNMDYGDEQRFASTAEKLARTGADVVDLTARKTWRDQNGKLAAGYFDAKREQGFGYGEWAVRSGLGAFYNWATVNSLLPAATNRTDDAFADQSIKTIDRGTVTALQSLASQFEAVQTKLNALDAGLNPLGLSENAIPFDVDPSKLVSDDETAIPHFEQIRERAEKALDNAQAVLDYAEQYASRIAQIMTAEQDDYENQETTELAYKNQLIALYGTPYPGDIGPAGTYAQGYDGPDIYHYTWMDLGAYGLSSIDSYQTKTITKYVKPDGVIRLYGDLSVKEGSSYAVTYQVTPGGISVKPREITGTRLTEGSIQTAYRTFIAAYAKLEQAKAVYDAKVTALENRSGILKAQFGMAQTKLAFSEVLKSAKLVSNILTFTTQMTVNTLSMADDLGEDTADTIYKSAPKIIGAGLTVNYDPSSVVGAVAHSAALGVHAASAAAKSAAEGVKLSSDLALGELELTFGGIEDGFDFYDKTAGFYDAMCAAVTDVSSAANDLQNIYAEVVAAEAAYRAEVQKGEALQEERAVWRQHRSNAAVAHRYEDMFYRIQRNNALTKYTTAYDTAQRYVWELAKVYDYETGLLSSDTQSGAAFYGYVVGSRALGTKGVMIVPDGTDGGLWDIVTRLSANWEVLKGRLGVNSADDVTKEFSLRYELFRIDPGEKGDAAWRDELMKYRVEDIHAVPEFVRYCQPLASTSGLAAKEPGLVIPFGTAINAAENFFGRSLQGGDASFSSSDYATKIHRIGVSFADYEKLTERTTGGLAQNPNVYLVPVGRDYMRAPGGTSRTVLSWKVIDQVLPLPYTIGSQELNDENWIATVSGLDGTGDATTTIRRHSTLPANGDLSTTRLAGRSVWNDRWMLVIPAASLNADREKGLQTFVNGIGDIKLKIKAYARSGN